MGDVLYPGGVRLTDAQHTALQLQGLHSEGGAVSETALAIGEPVDASEPEPIDALGQGPEEAMRPEDYPPPAPEDEQPDVPEPETPFPVDSPLHSEDGFYDGPVVKYEPSFELSEHPDFNQEAKPLIAPVEPQDSVGNEPSGEARFGLLPEPAQNDVADETPEGDAAPEIPEEGGIAGPASEDAPDFDGQNDGEPEVNGPDEK